jgi:hypothetical protein
LEVDPMTSLSSSLSAVKHKLPEGGPAFPSNAWDRDEDGLYELERYQGVTVRVYLAAKAMAALIASPPAACPCQETGHDQGPALVAREALAYADALLVALGLRV